MIDVVAELQQDNPGLRLIDLQLFADALATYKEAAKNIRSNGSIVMHPRTGAPIDNPYLKIASSSGAIIGKLGRIESDRVVTLLDIQDADQAAIMAQ